MSTVLTLIGSPSAVSRSAFLAQALERQLADAGVLTRTVTVRDLPADDLLHARFDSPAVVDIVRQVADADAIVISTPIYKAAYSGILKALLDLLPQTAFANKLILPLATGGSPAHFLAVDYALKPVLSALGARHVLSTVYATDSQISKEADAGYLASDEIVGRLRVAAEQLLQALDHTPSRRSSDLVRAVPLERVQRYA